MKSNEQATRRKGPTKQEKLAAIDLIVQEKDPTGRRHKNWEADAACNDANRELFFVDSSAGKLVRAEYAKNFCRVCPVVDVCLAFAFDNDTHKDAIMGNTTGAERKEMLNTYIAQVIEAAAAPAEAPQADIPDQAVA